MPTEVNLKFHARSLYFTAMLAGGLFVSVAAAYAQSSAGFIIEPSIEDLIDSQKHDERIVGGEIATKGQWQSMAAIFIKDKKGSRNFCGGTVIGKRYVLTAAHCVAAMNRMRSENSSVKFFIREKTHNIQGKDGRDVEVISFVTHEEYDPKLTLNDIGLLRLATDTEAPPQKLLGSDMVGDSVKRGRPSIVVGFGLTAESGELSARLRQVVVPIVDQEECRRTYDNGSITNVNFCAGVKEGGKDSCQGDSGGPLFLPDTTSGEQLQAGIVSWGRGCARRDAYGVYASVGAFEKWVKTRVIDAVFQSKASAAQPVSNVISGLTEGAAQANKPQQLAQLTIDIAQGTRVTLDSFIDVKVTSSVSGVVVVFAENEDGTSKQIYPSKTFPAPGPDPYVAAIEAGTTLSIPSELQREQGYRFIIRPPVGTSYLRAIVAPAKPKVIDAIRQHADGNDLGDLKDVIGRIVDAEMIERGAEPIRVTPTDRATASVTFEIMQKN